MPIKYEKAEDIQIRMNEIANILFPYVKLNDVSCLRSFGSSSRGTIARCHALGKAMQLGLGRKGFYVIEVISKRFDKMPLEEQDKVIIHELMHIPKCFGGGFIHHDVVCEENVEKMHRQYINFKNKNLISNEPQKKEVFQYYDLDNKNNNRNNNDNNSLDKSNNFNANLNDFDNGFRKDNNNNNNNNNQKKTKRDWFRFGF